MKKRMNKAFFVFILSLFIVNFLLGCVVAEGDSTDVSKYANSFLDGEVTHPFLKWVANFMGVSYSGKEIFIGLIILLILFAGIYDVLELVSIFQSRWVKMIMAGGLAIIGALSGLVNTVSLGLASIAAGFGAFAIFFEIIISIGVFIGLSVASPRIQAWAARRKAYSGEIKSIKSISQLTDFVKAGKKLGRELQSNE